MIKVKIKNIKKEPNLKLEFYDTISRIPLNIKLRNDKVFSNVLKFDNLQKGNFVEFRFDKDSGDLFEITIVSINNDTVKLVDEIQINVLDKQSNGIFIHALETKGVRNSLLTKITSTSNSICFTFGNDHKLGYYKISGGLYIGIDSDHNLKSFYLEGLSKENIADIFGASLNELINRRKKLSK